MDPDAHERKSAMDSRKTQRGGHHSTNIQAEVIHYGVSYADARQIALDVFRSNAAKLSEQAMVEASRRAQVLTEHYLKRLFQAQPSIAGTLLDPDGQRELFLAQQDFVDSSGAEELAELLAEMLVRRSRGDDGDLTSTKVLLTQSMRTAPQLTLAELEALGLLFFLWEWPHVPTPFDGRHPDAPQLRTAIHEGLARFRRLDSSIDLTHLTLLGCLHVHEVQPISFVLQGKYPFIFTAGMSRRSFHGKYRVAYVLREKDGRLVIPVSLDEYPEYLRDRGLALDAHQARRRNIRTHQVYNPSNTIRKYVENDSSHVQEIFRAWDASIGSGHPTLLGTAIGHAYWQYLSGQSLPLERFIA
jgi:hypothetical protein